MVKSTESVQNIKVSNTKIESPWKVAFKRLKRNKLAMISLFVLILLILAALFARLLTPYGPNEMVNTYGESILQNKRMPPDSNHLLGTDDLGRDMLTRIIYGGRISLSVGLVSVSLQILLGIIFGCLAGYYGGITDSIIMRLADTIMSFPFLLIAITIVAIIPSSFPSIFAVMLVIGVLGWPGISRIIRAQILSLKEQEFMEAAEALGLSDKRKIFKHLLPNTMALIIVYATIGIAAAILTETGLSFLGMGVTPPTPSWGNMVQTARSIPNIQKRWWLWVPPGTAIFLTVMSLNILGDGLRDALDPKMKK